MQASQKNGKTHFPKERSRTTLEFYWKNRTWNSTGIMWCQSKIALRAIASNKSNPSTMTINRFIMKASTRAQFGLPESIDRYINAWTSSSTFGTRAVGKTHFQHLKFKWYLLNAFVDQSNRPLYLFIIIEFIPISILFSWKFSLVAGLLLRLARMSSINFRIGQTWRSGRSTRPRGMPKNEGCR